MKIEYRTCDRCNIKLKETYNELTVVETGKEQKLGAWYPMKTQKDLCNKCYKELLNFFKGKTKWIQDTRLNKVQN